MNLCMYRLSLLVCFGVLFTSISMAEVGVLDEEISFQDVLVQEILDNQSQTSLEGVDFGLTVFPETVRQGDTVTYTFSISNNSSQTLENARISHMLPLGLTFFLPESFPGNLTIETTNGPNDTLVLRDLYLASNMRVPFVFTMEAYVHNWSVEGRTYNQAILDIFTSSSYDQIVSDSNENSVAEDKTELVIVPVIVSVPVVAPSVASTNPVVVRPLGTGVNARQSSGSGKAGSRWAGMRREDLLKGGMGATEAESKAFVAKLNANKPYQVKTYVDRNGSTKYYGIVKGKKGADEYTAAPSRAPLYRSSRTNVISVKPKVNPTRTIRHTTRLQRGKNAVDKNLKIKAVLRR